MSHLETTTQQHISTPQNVLGAIPMENPEINPSPQPEPMTRGQQTAWILGALIVLFALGTFIFMVNRPANPFDMDAPCRHWYGDDKDCLLDHARYRMSNHMEY